MTQNQTQENSVTDRALSYVPPVDVYENDQEVMVQADLPGTTPESLKVNVDYPELSISAETPNRLRYARSFRLGAVIDPKNIQAELKNGVLTLHLPKSEPYRSRKIEVRAS